MVFMTAAPAGEAAAIRCRTLRLSKQTRMRAGRRIKTAATAWRQSSPRDSLPPRARRHAIVPSTPTATTSAPHST